MELKHYLAENNEILERELDLTLAAIPYENVIKEGMRYAILNGGKRIRPNLLFLTLRLLGKPMEAGIPTAMGIEMIHGYSLVHDDLPAIDNDDYRRGKLTTHKKFGEAQGILVGDALLTFAFQVLSERNKDLLTPEQTVRIIAKTADYAGIGGMLSGQIVDIEGEGRKIDLSELQFMHAYKTGRLLKLPVECGAIIGDASGREYEALEQYAEALGLAFQIKDDILDVEGDFEKLGKPIGSDAGLGKSTYPSIIGMDESKRLLRETVERAKAALADEFGGPEAELMLELADFVGSREK
ncbi:MAG: polyprenyl synthetase family protein [Fusobacteriaceae bacterium]|jgi:geranylgeranyl diphosphate synthase type II|nr:polyprenyl synthetase family protein [Fusobacteriaceae bacterium]